MASELVDADPETAALFAAADQTLGFPLSAIIREGPDEDLQQTPVQQPAILLVSIAYLRALQKRNLLPVPAFVAGHSLGEYAALVAAGSLAFDDALRLVRRRGELMQEHGAGAMAAILGLPPQEVAIVARAAGAEVANYNAPDQTTVSGCGRPSNEPWHSPGSAGQSGHCCCRSARRFIRRAWSRPRRRCARFWQPYPCGPRSAVDRKRRCASSRRSSDLRRELSEQICGSVRWVDGVNALRRRVSPASTRLGRERYWRV